MTLFGLVRHGQTDYNRQGLFQGSSDIPLNETGIQQAHQALDRVPELHWDVVVTSPLQRAEQTGRIIAADHGIPFGQTVPQLREIDWGRAEGMDVAEAEARWPKRSFPGREDYQAAADRSYDALEKLADQYPGKNVLVVAHGALIRFLLSGIAQRPLGSIPNAALSLVRLTGMQWTLEMLASEPVEHTVRTVPRDQHPRFIVEHPRPVPDTDATMDAADPTIDRGPEESR